MMLNAASMAAVFVEQAKQAECAAQCIQTAPWTWWSGLLQFLPQLIVSVIPVAGGVGIALWSFHANNGKEHAQRLLDQRAGEWRSVLDALLSAYEGLPPAFSEALQELQSVNSSASDGYLRNAWQVKSRIETLLFILEQAKAINLAEKFQNLVETAKKMKIALDSEGKFGGFVQADLKHYRMQFDELLKEVHKTALEDAAKREKARISFWNPYRGI